MAQNSLAPGFLKVKYTSNGHPHVQTIGIKPDDLSDPDDMTAFTKFGTSMPIEEWLTTVYGPIWQGFYALADSLTEAEVWEKPTPEDDPVFRGLIAIALAGTVSGGATLAFGQGTLTFRAVAGGIARLYLMEPRNFTVNQHDPRPFSDTRVSDMAGILTDSSSIWYARDNSYLTLGLTWNTKTNDALRKKYVLNA